MNPLLHDPVEVHGEKENMEMLWEVGTDAMTREHVVGAKLCLEPEMCQIFLAVSCWDIFVFILTKILFTKLISDF